jgi:ADP-glucose pyrophosphorylase
VNAKSVAAVILGGGAGTRLYPLTKQRAKPAVPIGGAYRLIDVPMSNCINSGISKMYVLTQVCGCPVVVLHRLQLMPRAVQLHVAEPPHVAHLQLR